MPEVREHNSPAALIAVAGASVALLAAGAWVPAWSRDEAATAMVVRRPLDQVLRTFGHDPALGPYYLAMHLWGTVSTSELWLRLPSVLAAAATVVVLIRIAERFVRPPAALLAGLVLLLLPATTRFGQDARPYASTMLVAALLVLCWLQDRRLATWRARIRLATLIVILGLLHAYALLLVGVLALVALARPLEDRRREVLAVVGVGAAAALVLTPFLLPVARGGQGQPHTPALDPVNLAVETLRLPAGVLSPSGAPVLGVVIFALVAAGWLLGWRHGGAERTGALLAAAWLVLPPAMLCGVQAVTDAPGLVARYWTFCLPAIALGSALALGAAWRVRRALAVGVVVLVGALGVPAQLALRSPDGHAGQGWRELPGLLDHRELADSAVLVEGSHYRAVVANHPGVAVRMPLVADPGPSGRILPRVERADSRSFRTLRTHYALAVVLQNLPRPSTATPTVEAFVDFPSELRWFSRPLVLCSYFGFPLGVFASAAAGSTDAQARRIAQVITAVHRDEVVCTTS